MVVTIDRIAGRLKLRLGELFGEDTILYLELRMCKDKEDLRAKLVSIYQRLLSSAKSKNETADNTLASSMIQYVKEHYHEDLSLTDLADRFNLSSNYISTLFKTFTGENFRDYTNISKIDRAIEIMKENPAIKIYDVAKMVGYDNANSFIRMFKRYKGVTPGQYMKSAK